MALHVGEIGVTIECDMVEDVSDASTFTIFLQQPDANGVVGALITKTATLVSGSTTKIECSTASGDLPRAGAYRIQPKAVWSNGHVVYGDETKVQVLPVLG